MTDTTLPEHPFGTQISASDIALSFQKAVQWEDRYREIIRLSRQMPTLPDQWRNANNEIFGCENRVWLASESNQDKKMHFVIESESRIVKGLLAILLTQCEGLPAQSIVSRDLLAIFTELGIATQLSATRFSGLSAVAQAIHSAAKAALNAH